MNLVKYTLCDIELVMVDIEGVLYCSTPQLERVFGADHSNLSKLVRRYPHEFSQTTIEALTGYNVPRKEIIEALEIKRLRKNTRLWSEDDVIGITWLVRSDIARQCRAQFKEILKLHARVDHISADRVEAMIQAQIAPLQAAVANLMADRKEMASYAGRSLRLIRDKQ
jgi:hypothetical protein